MPSSERQNFVGNVQVVQEVFKQALSYVRRRNSARWSWSPPLFAETIQTLVKQLESKINIWYLDDGNLADDYKVVLRDLKNILKSEQIYGLGLNTEKCELCFLGPTTSTQYNSILTQLRKICPKIKLKTKELLILGSSIDELCRKELLDEKIKELENISDIIDKLDAHYGFYLLKNCFSMPKLLYFLRTSPCCLRNDFLDCYAKLLRNSLCKVTNVKMDDKQFYKQFSRQPKVAWAFLPLVYSLYPLS